WIVAFEIEWPKINDVKRAAFNSVKGHADKALLRNILAFDVEFDGPVPKIESVEPCQALVRLFIQSNPFLRTLLDSAYRAVDYRTALAIDECHQIRLKCRLLGPAPTSSARGAGDQREQ